MVKWKDIKFRGNAEIVADEIASIGDEATPKDILNYAKQNPDSELHKCFEWNDGVAAEKWRLQQARFIVCNLVYVKPKEETDSNVPPLRVMYCVKDAEDKPVYKRTELIVRNQDNYQAMLSRAWNELRAFKLKYQCLTELEAIFDLIN